MKTLIALLLASSSLAFGAANDLLITQRNSTDTGQFNRLVTIPVSGSGVMIYNGTSVLPQLALMGDGMVWNNGTGTLSVGITTAMQSALDAKENLLGVGSSTTYLRGDHVWATLATVATSGSYADLTSKPTLGTAAAQNSTAFATSTQGTTADSALQPSGNGSSLTGLTKSQVSLGNVDNTSDANKPVSTAQAASIATKLTIPAGTTAEYVRGNGTLATLPTVASLSFTSNPSRSIVTVAAAANGWQLSSTRNAQVSYAASVSTTATIGGAAGGYVLLEIAATNSSTASDWVEVARPASNTQTITLAIALQSVQVIGGTGTAIVPAGYYARLRFVNTGGTASASYIGGQEVLMS